MSSQNGVVAVGKRYLTVETGRAGRPELAEAHLTARGRVPGVPAANRGVRHNSCTGQNRWRF